MTIDDFEYEKTLGGYSITGYKGKEGHVVIPEGVVEIAQDAFCENETILSVEFPESLVEICFSAFYDCPNLSEIKFHPSGSLREMGQYCFGYCQSLKRVELPDSLYYVGAESFYQCCEIEYAKIPGCIDMVKSDIFLGCPKLHEIIVVGTAIPPAWHKEWNSTNADVIFMPKPLA